MFTDIKIKESPSCVLNNDNISMVLNEFIPEYENDNMIKRNKNNEVHDKSVNSVQKELDFRCISIKLQVEEVLQECDMVVRCSSIKQNIKTEEVWFQNIQSNSSVLCDHNYSLSQNIDKENTAVPASLLSDKTETHNKETDEKIKTNIASLKYPTTCLEKLDLTKIKNYENCISNNVIVDTEQLPCAVGISNLDKNIKGHSKTPYICEVCDKDFSHLSHLNLHRKTHARKKTICCDICGKTFTRICNLNIHKNIHNNLKPYACNLCSKSFTDKSTLNRHKHVHTNTKPHMCDICGIYYTRLYRLRRHRRTHTGEKPFACELCGKLFTVIDNLIIHNKNVHSNDKPYVCDVCDRGFKMLHHYRRHRLIHTGEKPFICDNCGKAFTQRCSLKQHINEHTGNKPFKCSLCDMRFGRSDTLNYHKLSHTVMTCPICGKRFKCKQYLKKHVKLH